MMYVSDLGFVVISTNFGRNLVRNFRKISMPIICSVQMISSIKIFLIDESKIVKNYVPYPAGPVDCGVHKVLLIDCKSLGKVAIFRPA